MHTLKKLVGGGGHAGGGSTNGSRVSSSTGDSELETQRLNLLIDLVRNLLQNNSNLSPQDKRKSIRDILPLVLTTFKDKTGTEICAKFEMVAQFGALICRLFVEEIRARARPSSTVEASRAIMSYLSGNDQGGFQYSNSNFPISSTQQSCQASAPAGEFGKNLLLCLELICSASKQVCDELVSGNLPSTLVKCVYIFYDLPPPSPSTQNSNETQERLAVKDSIRYLLSQLMRYSRAVEELTNGDDLFLLLTSVTNFCAPHNLMWRETASATLTTLSANCLSRNIVKYISKKEGIKTCIAKMKEIGQFSPLEIVEMFVTIFCLLKDSSSIETMLLEDFEREMGYEFLKEFLVKMDQCECEANIDATIRTLALSVLSLVYCGKSELKPPTDLDIQFSLPDFSIPQPSNRGRKYSKKEKKRKGQALYYGHSLRNIRAFDVLQQTFVNCNSASLLRTILEVVSTIYNADVSNFFILYNQKTLVAFAHVIPSKSPEVWAHYFDLLDFVATTLRFVPLLELITLTSHLENRSNLEFCRVTLQFVQTLTLFHPIYTKVLNHCDLLRVLTSTIVHLSNHQSELGLHNRHRERHNEFSLDVENLSYYHFVVQTLIMILKDNETNIVAFKSFGGAAVHHLIGPESTRSAALLLIQTLLCSSVGEDDTSRLIQRLSTIEQSDIKLKVDILRCLSDSLRQHSVVRSRFRLSQGFIHISSLITGLTNSLSNPPLPPWDAVESKEVFVLLEIVLETVASALFNDPANVKYFTKEVKFDYLVNSLLLLGCFEKRSYMPNYHHVEDGHVYLNHNPSNYFVDEFEAKKDLPNYNTQIKFVLSVFSYLMKVAIDCFNTPAIKLEDNTPAIIHPGAIVAMITLLPAVSFPNCKEWECAIHYHVLCVVRKLVLSCDRNAQLLSRAGLIRVLISPIGAVMLLDEHHPSHITVHSILDRLSAQRIEVRDLRMFLRLGSPLHCLFNENDAINKHVPTDDRWRLLSTAGLVSNASGVSLSNKSSDNVFTQDDSITAKEKCQCCICQIKAGNVPLNTIKSLVSFTTRKDNSPMETSKRMAITDQVEPPAFIEFNLKFESFGCIFIPNLVPHAVSPSTFVNSAGTVAAAAFSSTASQFVSSNASSSGPSASSSAAAAAASSNVTLSSSGDHRVFPPNNGISFVCWINLIELPNDCNHHIRLCTISRHYSAARSESIGSSAGAGSVKTGLTSPGSGGNDGGRGSGNGNGYSSGNLFNTPSSFDFVEMQLGNNIPGDNVFFQIGISAVDHSLVVSTREVADGPKSFIGLDDPTGISSNYDLQLRSELLKQTNRWIHVAVVLTKGFVKQSTCSIYLNGNLCVSNKMNYISSANSNLLSAPYVTNMSIGTPQAYAIDKCNVKWKMASAHLIEDSLSATQISHMYNLGVSYNGSFQRCPVTIPDNTHSSPVEPNKVVPVGSSISSSSATNQSSILQFNPTSVIVSAAAANSNSSQYHHMAASHGSASGTTSSASSVPVFAAVNEDKIIWAINAKSLSVMSLSKIKKVFGKPLSASISKLLKLSITDEVYPVRFLLNGAAHLQGPARAQLGGIIMGHSAVRVFTPSPLLSTINKIGAPLIILELVAKSDTIERLYASVKLLNTLLPWLDVKCDMDEKKWFQTLSIILERKSALINTHVAQIILETIGITDFSSVSSPSKQYSPQQNCAPSMSSSECRLSQLYQNLALTEVLLNLDIWRNSSAEVQLLVYQSLTNATSDFILADVMINHAIIPRITAKLRETQSSSPLATSNALIRLAVSLMARSPPAHIACLAQYIASLLMTSPTPPNNQSEHTYSQNSTEFNMIQLRNHALYCFINEAFSLDGSKLNTHFCSIVQQYIGFDWILLFLCDGKIHESTVVAAFRFLVIILLSPTGMSNFKHGTCNGNWLSITNSNTNSSSNSAKSTSHFDSQNNTSSSVINRQNPSIVPNNDFSNTPSSRGALQNDSNFSSNDVVFDQYGAAHLTFKASYCVVNGFEALQYCMLHHTHVTQLYYLLFALTLSKIPIRDPPDANVKFSGQELCAYADFRYPHSPVKQNSLSSMHTVMAPSSSGANILIEPLQVIIVMLQHAIHKLSVEERSRRLSDPDHPANTAASSSASSTAITNIIDSLLQLLQSLNHASVVQFFTAPVLHCITGVLFPPNIAYSQCGNERVKNSLLDLLRSIVIQSMMYPLPQKSLPVFDIIIDSCPHSHHSGGGDNSVSSPNDSSMNKRSRHERKQFITDLSHCVMEYILKSDILNPTNAALPFAPGGSHQYVSCHLVYFSSRIVDLLWQESLNKKAYELIEFLCHLVQQSETLGTPENGFYLALNRVLIYDLSKVPNSELLDQMYMLECFRKYVAKRKFIFSPNNNDAAFLGALCCKVFTTVESSKNANNREFVLTGCQRLWDTIIDKKRELVEHVFRVNLPQNTAQIDVSLFSDKFYDASQKHWHNFVKEEIERSSMDPFTLYSQLNQSKISRWGGNLTKGIASLTSKGSSGSSKQSSSGVKTSSKMAVDIAIHQWMQCHSYLSVENMAAVQAHLAQLKKNLVEATAITDIENNTSDLLSERGLWGPLHSSRLDKWTLDMTEGPCRMRKRMKHHKKFYTLYPYRPDQEQNKLSTRKRAASSSDSKYYFAKHGLLLRRAASVPSPSSSMKTSKVLKSQNTVDCNGRLSTNDDNDNFENVSQESKLRPEVIEEEESNVVIDPVDDGDAAGDHEEMSLEASIKEMQLTDSRCSRQLVEESGGDIGTIGQDSENNTTKYNELHQKRRSRVSNNSESEVKEPRSGGDGDETSQQTVKSLKSASSFTSVASSERNRLESATSLIDVTLSGDSSQNNTSTPSLFTVLGASDVSLNCTMCRCARIQGLDNFEGLMIFFRECFYIVDGYTMIHGEVKDIDCLQYGEFDPIIPKTGQSASSEMVRSTDSITGCSKTTATSNRSVLRLNYDEMREIHKRRYLLQPIALELFSADGRSLLLAFPVSHGHQSDRNKAYHKLLTFCPSLTTSAAQSISGQKASTSVEGSSSLISSFIGEKSVTQRWERGEISNFQYLMHLNTLAGRSYNDLMQYPVFPWILKDYDSETLDLDNPKSFRDLSKPMGAQNEERLDSFLKRFREWESDHHFDTPPYHYGTHYSSAMIVCSFLVRLEPFTSSFLRLQGGHFDLADRMFHSIKDTWLSASKNNMADVKELIPEFFYLPQFLRNENKFDLGRKQNGTVLNDVVMPTWAKGSTDEFIRMHREALESDYVSAHLHEWIDLIFGYKQRGPAAREAHNLFHHLFYEGNVDIYNISDPLKKNAVIGFINNFGQIPEQLFKKPHPVRKAFLTWSVERPFGTVYPTSKIFYHQPDNMQPSIHLVKLQHRGSVGQIRIGGSAMDKVLSVEQNMLLVPNQNGRFLAWGYIDGSIRMGMATDSSDKLVTIYESMCCHLDVLFATMPNEKYLFTGGNSGVLTAWNFNPNPVDESKTYLKKIKQIYGHHGPITCMASSSNYHVVVSGSKDCTAIVWDVNTLQFVRQLPNHFAPINCCHVNNLSGEIITTCGWYMYVWTINCEPIAFINTAITSHQVYHSGLSSQRANALSFSQRSSSTNSSAISGGGSSRGATTNTNGITCLSASELNEWSCENVILTGSADGVVRMWSIEMCPVAADDCSEREDIEGVAEDDFFTSERSLVRDQTTATTHHTNEDHQDMGQESLSSTINAANKYQNQQNSCNAANSTFQTSSTSFRKRYSLDSLEDAFEENDTSLIYSPLADMDEEREKSCDDDNNQLVTLDIPPPSSSLTGSRAIPISSTSTQRDSSGSTYAHEIGSVPPTPESPFIHTASPSSDAHVIRTQSSAPTFPTSASCDVVTDEKTAIDVGEGGLDALGDKAVLDASCVHEFFHVVTEDDIVNIEELREAESRSRRSTAFIQIEAPEEPRTSLSNSEIEKSGSVRSGGSGVKKWRYQIVFRTKLTAHTAYERQDNPYPAPVTAIAIHPDHNKLYVGDGRGRVLQWLVCDSPPGKAPVDHWMRDEGSTACMSCSTSFSFTERRHHCRNCGKLFCSKCSNYQSSIPQKRIITNVRVCQACFILLNEANNRRETNEQLLV